ncbi:unnamed protein product [Colias eurytheme]|nr:unnamed protein product [Colias eurytheme]
MSCILLLITIILNIGKDCDSAKILAAFPTPAISHQVVFRPLIHELVKRGHEVVVITPNPAFPPGRAPPNLTEVDVHDISYSHFEEILKGHDGKKSSLIQQFLNVFEKFTSTFEKQIQTPEVQKILKEEGDTFDLIIVEAIVRATGGLGHLLKKPIIQFNSAGAGTFNFHQFGAPVNPIVFPSLLNQRVYDLNWWDKIIEFSKFLLFEYLWVAMYDYDHSMVKRNFGEDAPSFEELHEKYVQMLFVNEHPIWASNHPVPTNVVFLGGINQAPAVNLSTDLQTYLDFSKNGVIYVSFGSSVRTANLPTDKVRIMTKVFSELPYDILWKWDQDELPGRSKNIKISKWLPQHQLLKHPNIKLFITQGGLQSTDEAINAAVPVIGIPMLGDQWYNTEKYAHHKIGLQLDINTLTDSEFRSAVKTVVEDKSYKDNMVKLRTLMRSYPIEPLDLAVWWTEHILKHGGAHLRSPAFNMSYLTYYEVPLILSLLSALIVLIIVIIIGVRSLKRFLCGRRKVKTT